MKQHVVPSSTIIWEAAGTVLVLVMVTAYCIVTPLLVRANTVNKSDIITNAKTASPTVSRDIYHPPSNLDGQGSGVADTVDFDPRLIPSAPSLEVTKQGTPNPVQTGGQLTYTICITNTGDVDLHATVADTLPAHVMYGVGTVILHSDAITWTPTIAPDRSWTTVVVARVEMDYTGPLANVVQVTTEEGATGVCTHTTMAVSAPPFAGVTFSPAYAIESGAPGDIIIHSLSLHNAGNVADTFTLALGGHRWPTSIPPTSIELGPGQARTLAVTVTIPVTATAGMQDTAVLTATSSVDPSVSAQATIDTVAGTPPHTLQVVPDSLSFSATDGGSNPTAQFINITVPGGGGGTLGWMWTASDNASWLGLSINSGMAPATVAVLVDITGLDAGTYSGQIIVSSGGETAAVAVTLVVNSTSGSAPPVVSAIDPSSASNAVATTVTILGASFQDTPTVYLDSVPLSSVSRLNEAQLQAIVSPDWTPGTYDVTVRNPDGQEDTLLQAFTVFAPQPPVPTLLLPMQGPNDIPVTVDIYGSNMAPGLTATLGIALLENVLFIDSHHVQAVIPAGLPLGVYTLTLTKSDGTPGSLPDAYQVIDATLNDDLWSSASSLWLEPATIHQGDSDSGLGLVVYRQGGQNILSNVEVSLYSGPPVTGTRIGTGTIVLLSPHSQASTSKVMWMPDAGAYTLYAVIDPRNQVAENNEGNNVISRTVTVLPAQADTQAPHVDSFSINNGTGTTNQRQVELSATASDTGGSGVGSLLYIEYQFIESIGDWAPAANSGWQPYTLAKDDYPWALLPVAGAHYLQAWASDNAGNVSLYPYQRYINYLPPTDHVARDQTRVYRQDLVAGQVMTVTVTPISGDPDLYIWAPDWQSEGRPPWVSNMSGTVVDQCSVEAPISGTYQIEVYGYTSADYQLEVQVSSGAGLTRQVLSASEVSGVGSKLVPSAPVIAVDSIPSDVGVALPSIDITNRFVYLPLVLRNS